jgi:hypothetical protein
VRQITLTLFYRASSRPLNFRCKNDHKFNGARPQRRVFNRGPNMRSGNVNLLVHRLRHQRRKCAPTFFAYAVSRVCLSARLPLRQFDNSGPPNLKKLAANFPPVYWRTGHALDLRTPSPRARLPTPVAVDAGAMPAHDGKFSVYLAADHLASSGVRTPKFPQRALQTFRNHIVDLWRRTLRRRSQTDRMTWGRISKLADDFLPKPRILHPWPSARFAGNPRGGSRMPELGPYGSVRGARGNPRPYRDHLIRRRRLRFQKPAVGTGGRMFM